MKIPLRKKSKAAEKQALTPDALAALRRAGFSRRSFLKSTGALIVRLSVAGINKPAEAQESFAGGVAGSPPLDQVDSWIAIGADGNVTAYTGKCELGQGIVTAQTQLVAEELSVPFSRVKLIYCDTSMTPDQGVTSGSQSHPANFNKSNLVQAGATARQALLQLAAKQLGVPADQLTAKGGVISAKSDPSREIKYGQML